MEEAMSESMKSYENEEALRSDAFSKTKVAFSGKSGVDQDDLVMTFIIMTYWVQKALNTQGVV